MNRLYSLLFFITKRTMTKKIPYSAFKHGQRCTCEIDGKKVSDARINIDPHGDVYIVQEGKDRICISTENGTYFDSSKEEDYFVANLVLLPRTIEDVEEGDITINEDGDERKVLGRCGQVVFLSKVDKFQYLSQELCTITELKGYGWTIKQDTPLKDVEHIGKSYEFTMQEVADKFGVPVERLRIKE